MAKKKTVLKKNRLDKKYTHAEFLQEFFPNVDPETLHDDEDILTEDQFFDILERVIKPLPLPSDEEKSETSG
jgi:hypothetical protein